MYGLKAPEHDVYAGLEPKESLQGVKLCQHSPIRLPARSCCAIGCEELGWNRRATDRTAAMTVVHQTIMHVAPARPYIQSASDAVSVAGSLAFLV